MNYEGWENEETKQASYYFFNNYDLYNKAMDYKNERSIGPDVLAYHLKDLLRIKAREDKRVLEYIGDMDRVNFLEIAQDFYGE